MDLPPGLVVTRDFISVETERSLLDYIDTQEWTTPARSGKGRRVQHYGYHYNYLSRSALREATPIPALFEEMISSLSPIHGENPNQVIVNEYLRQQGIAAHVDAPSQFGAVITTVSLGDEAVMVFRHVETGEEIMVLLPPRSSVSMTGDSRYKWTHAIPSRVTYLVDGKKKTRPENWRRVSVTFRSVV